MGAYFDELCRAMALLAADPRTIFMGQAVACPGTAMSGTFRDVPRERLLELPVAEDMQMGMAVGMALEGLVPVCCYPRWNFVLLAMSQLVLHLDKIPIYSHGGFRPKIIIRTAVGAAGPLDPGPQHLGDFGVAVQSMLHTVYVSEVRSVEAVLPAYHAAMRREFSTIIVEHMEMYGNG